MSGARITQRHVASEEDLAYASGKGLLVRAGVGCAARRAGGSGLVQLHREGQVAQALAVAEQQKDTAAQPGFVGRHEISA